MLLTVTGLAGQVLGFLYRILLSRMIGAEVMGLYQLVMPVYSVLMSLTAAGLTAAVSALTSEYRALGNWRAAWQTLGQCLALAALLLLLPAACVLLFSDPISVYLLGDARTQLGLVLLLPCVLLTGVENIHKHAFYGAGLVRPPAFTELLEQVVRACAVLGLLLLLPPQSPEGTVGIIVTGMVLCEVFSACALTLLHRRWRRSVTGPLGPGERRGKLTGRVIRIAAPIAMTSLLGNLIGAANAVLIPQRLVYAGADVNEAMGAFGVLCGMTAPMLQMPTVFIGAMGLVLVPRLARSAALGRLDRVRSRVHKAMLATSVLILPAMALLVVLGPDLARFLFREERAGEYILPLAAAVALSCYQSVLSGVLNGVGLQRAAAWNAILCGAVQLGCTYFLMGLPGAGLGGYVAGAVVSSALGVVLNWRRVGRYARMRPRLFQLCTAPALAALLTGLCVNLLFHILRDAGVGGGAAGAVCLVFGTAEYGIALTAQGVDVGALFGLRGGKDGPAAV